MHGQCYVSAFLTVPDQKYSAIQKYWHPQCREVGEKARKMHITPHSSPVTNHTSLPS